MHFVIGAPCHWLPPNVVSRESGNPIIVRFTRDSRLRGKQRSAVANDRVRSSI